MVFEESLKVGEIVVHVHSIGVEVYADQQHLVAVVPHKRNDVIVCSVDMFSSQSQQVASSQQTFTFA